MSRILVTGASGYIARATLGPLTELGFEVHGVCRRPPGRTGVTWHRVDLFNGPSRRRLLSDLRPSHILHLAWCTEHGRYWTDPANNEWRDMTVALAREFETAGGERFIGVGSCAEYDWRLAIGPISETAPLDAVSPYGRA